MCVEGYFREEICSFFFGELIGGVMSVRVWVFCLLILLNICSRLSFGGFFLFILEVIRCFVDFSFNFRGGKVVDKVRKVDKGGRDCFRFFFFW